MNRGALVILIFGGDVILGDFMSTDFLLPTVAGSLDAGYHFSLEGVAFLQQLVNTFRIRSADIR